MINPFTIQSKINKLQQEVLLPLYTMHREQEEMQHEWLLVMTGRVIATHQNFLEELTGSRLVAAVFKIVKLLGSADNLTDTDFARFTSYVNEGGIKSMVKMLLAADKEQMFVTELRELPQHNRENAHQMLTKSATLHQEFITGFFKEQYGSMQATPQKLVDNFEKSTNFITRLAFLAGTENGKKRK